MQIYLIYINLVEMVNPLSERRIGDWVSRLNFTDAELSLTMKDEPSKEGSDMKEFVEYIVKHLVDNPEAVKVSEVVGETTVVYELKVDQPDMGKVIGKNGRTAHAIRVLLSAVARKAGKHATLEILE